MATRAWIVAALLLPLGAWATDLGSSQSFMAAAPAAAGTAAQSGGGPGSRWAFEGNYRDSAGRNHGRPVGDVGFSSDHAPVLGSLQSLRLSNAEFFVHDYVLVADSPSLDVDPDEATTIALWVKIRGEPSYASDYHILGKRDQCQRMNYQLASDYGGYHFNAFDGNRVDTAYRWGLPTGRWVHLAVTYEPTAGDLLMYVDGLVAGSAAGYTLYAVNDAPLTIGDSGQEACPFRGLPGLIDDVRLYDRALTAAEVAELATPRPATRKECQRGGWHAFPGFKNQGDCVSYVATGGRNPPASP